ncbi:MAG TPA: hypothetical protein VFQ39_00790 [Longimicrobium sp.]|nr:hypothetical protein [Longimicrobium sp.]
MREPIPASDNVVMRSELYEELRKATDGEYELLGELDADREWMAYLARALADGALVVLMLERAGREEFELRVISEIDASFNVGRTRCESCGMEMDGWPRSCARCGHDLSGLPLEEAAAGSTVEILLEEVRAAAKKEFAVFGVMRHAESGGALYFAREEATGRIVGLVLAHDETAGLSLTPSWSMDDAALGDERNNQDDDPEPSPDPRSRRVWYAAAGALAMIMVVVLAVLLVQRQGAVSEAPGKQPRFTQIDTPQDSTRMSVDTTAPVPPWDSVTPSDTAKPKPPPRRQQQRHQRDTLRPPAPPAPPVVDIPTPEQDRERILQVLTEYVAALGSRDIARVRRAYPNIPAANAKSWENWFNDPRFPSNPRPFPARYTLQQEPEIQGDEAKVLFSVTIELPGRRAWNIRSRAELRRVEGGWALQGVWGSLE